MLTPGDPVPALRVRSNGNPHYALDSAAGRYVVISFVAATNVAGVRDYLEQLYQSGSLFNDKNACCYVVINDVADEQARSVGDRIPGIRVIWDTDMAVARTFGCCAEGEAGNLQIHLATFILDPGQRVLDVLPIEDPLTHFSQLEAAVSALPDPSLDMNSWAPVLCVPNVLEPELCRDYIAYAKREGLEDSGYMQTDPRTGQTMLVIDHDHKRRSDCNIEDADLRSALMARVHRRLVPQIERAFQFKVTRMERYMIASYDADEGGWFMPHKDNTTLGTAHRRFAVSINLNAEEYVGGDLRFPEFGPRTYRAPTGGAVVFSCSLLHEATPITQGRRFCILPFLYDDAAAQLRLENAQYLSDQDVAEAVVKSVLAPAGWFEKKEKTEV